MLEALKQRHEHHRAGDAVSRIATTTTDTKKIADATAATTAATMTAATAVDSTDDRAPDELVSVNIVLGGVARGWHSVVVIVTSRQHGDIDWDASRFQRI